MTSIPEPVLLDPARLKPHPRNYRRHPADQIAHLAASIAEHGFYGNVVAASDETILKGHGTVLAALELGMTAVPTILLPIDSSSPQALAVLAGDNEISRLAEVDDRRLLEILRDVQEREVDQLRALLGTGYDPTMLKALSFVTAPPDVKGARDAGDGWTGLPAYEGGVVGLRIVVHIESEVDREAFMKLIGASVVNKKSGGTWSIWFPEKQRQDLASLRFEPPPDE